MPSAVMTGLLEVEVTHSIVPLVPPLDPIAPALPVSRTPKAMVHESVPRAVETTPAAAVATAVTTAARFQRGLHQPSKNFLLIKLPRPAEGEPLNGGAPFSHSCPRADCHPEGTPEGSCSLANSARSF